MPLSSIGSLKPKWRARLDKQKLAQFTEIFDDKELAKFMPVCFHSLSAVRPEGCERMSWIEKGGCVERFEGYEWPEQAKEDVEGSERSLFIPKNTAVEHPIDLYYEQKTNDITSEVLHVIVEEGAAVTIHDKRIIKKGTYTRSLTAHIGANARVTWIEESDLGSEAFMLSTESWSLAKNSRVKTINALTGGKQSYAIKDYFLEEESAFIEHLSLAALTQKEQAALITRQHHKARATESLIHVKTLLLGESRSFYRGTISMNESAPESKADQQQRSLMLSDQSKTCAIPSLEVSTHDVSCRHGSAASRFNKDELWYLQSRGMNESSAAQLLIDGFFNEEPLVKEYKEMLTSFLQRVKQRNDCVM